MAPKACLPWEAILWTWTATTIICTSITIVFLIIADIALFSHHQPARIAATIAIVIQVFSLGMLFIVGWQEAFGAASNSLKGQVTARQYRNVLVNTIAATLAGVSTLVTAVWMGATLDNIFSIIDVGPSALVACLATTSVILIIASAALLISLLFYRRRDSTVSSVAGLSGPTTLTDMTFRPETSKSTVSNPFSNPASDSLSPPMTPTSTSRSSWRSSFTGPSRKSSIKQLISSRPSSRSEAAPSPFDNWDTSSVAPSLRETVNSSRANAPTRIVTKLPPIPGSRPASPAKPLDGPFLPPSPHTTRMEPFPPISPSRARSPSLNKVSPPLRRNFSGSSISSLPPPNAPFAVNSNPPSPSPANSDNSLPLNSVTNQPHVLPRSYSTTSLADSVSHLEFKGTMDERDIHPLFRSSSPTPPPGHSTGTVVTAASLGEALYAGVAAGSGTRSRGASIDGSRSRATSVTSGHPTGMGSPLARGPVWESLELVSRNGEGSVRGSIKGSIQEEGEKPTREVSVRKG